MCKRTCWVILLWALFEFADAAPKSVSVTYDILLNGLPVAVLSEHFEASDGHYQATSRSNPLGLFAVVPKLAVSFVSTGDVVRRGLRPHRFEGRRAKNDAIELSADFDWSEGRLNLSHDGKSESLSLPPGTQDRLSVMYQFMYLAPKGGRIDVSVTNGRGLDHYSYEATSGVEEETALGRMSTVHLVKQHEPGESQNEIWLAPDHAYVPVRMIIVERDGTRYEQVIQKLDVQS